MQLLCVKNLYHIFNIVFWLFILFYNTFDLYLTYFRLRLPGWIKWRIYVSRTTVSADRRFCKYHLTHERYGKDYIPGKPYLSRFSFCDSGYQLFTFKHLSQWYAFLNTFSRVSKLKTNSTYK